MRMWRSDSSKKMNSWAAKEHDAFERQRMISEQLESRGIREPRVLEAMRATPRHLFVPEALRRSAYQDRPLPIGYRATISQPYMVAFMTELLNPAAHHRLLEIGTGCGYQSAILAQLASHVYSMELIPELARSAAERLRELGYLNVTVREGDGYQGWPEEAPFDGIVMTAAPREIPDTLIEELAEGGRLVAPVGSHHCQRLIILDKHPGGRISRWALEHVSFVPMIPAGIRS